jgi:hypothetical protein|nr:MAG: hypothetical protein [Caudoviricetes sp.]
MSTTIVSAFGTFTESELDTLKKGLREMSDVMTMQEAQRDTMKELINHLYEELKIPKKLIRKMATTYHKRNYSEVIAEQEEFEALYEGIVKKVEDLV